MNPDTDDEIKEIRSPRVEDRRRKIVSLINQLKSVRVSVLHENLGVSEATIRDDLNDLERRGYIRRVHGGAVIVKGGFDEGKSAPFSARMDRFLFEKEKIAQFAVTNFIDSGEVLAVDASTTTTILIREIIRQRKDVTIITNAVNFANEVANYDGVNLILTGGEFHRSNLSLIGEVAYEFLDELHVDKTFIGTTSILFDEGLMTVNTGEAEIKKRMIKVSNEVFILATHNKIGRSVELVPFAEIVIKDTRLRLAPHNLQGEAKDFKIVTDDNFKDREEREVFEQEIRKFSSYNGVFKVVHIPR